MSASTLSFGPLQISRVPGVLPLQRKQPYLPSGGFVSLFMPFCRLCLLCIVPPQDDRGMAGCSGRTPESSDVYTNWSCMYHHGLYFRRKRSHRGIFGSLGLLLSFDTFGLVHLHGCISFPTPTRPRMVSEHRRHQVRFPRYLSLTFKC